MKLLGQNFKYYIPYSENNQQWPQILLLIANSITYISTGSLAAWTSPTIPILMSNQSYMEPITINEASYLAVIPLTVAAICAPVFAIFVDNIGRQKILVLMALCYCVSWLLILIAQDITTLYISRFITGLGDVSLFSSMAIYLGEVLEPNLRSYFGTLSAFNIMFGQFLVNLIGSYCTVRITAIILLWCPLVQTVLFAFIPESPYFCIIKNRPNDAKLALQRLRWTENIDEEFNVIERAVTKQLAERGTLKNVFIIPNNLKALAIILCLRFGVQFSGLPAFATFTQYMFAQSGAELSAEMSSIIFYGVFIIATIPSVLIINRYGRKTLMSISFFGCGVALSIMSCYLYVFENTDIDTSNYSWTPIVGMLLFILASSVGMTMLPNVMIGEVFSANIKSKALCITTIFFSLYAVGVIQLFHTLTESYGMYLPFCVFTVNCFLAAFFCFYCLPETGGKTLGQIQDEMKSTSKGVDNKV